jgi:AraC-like DNA-binding protein
VSILLFAEGVIILFFALSQLLVKDKLTLHYLMFADCLVMAYLFLYSWAAETGMILRLLPVLAGSDIPTLFLMAPLFYLTSLTILREGKGPGRRDLLFSAVPAAFALASCIYDASAIPDYLRSFGALPGHFATSSLCALSALAGAAILVAISLDLLAALRIHRSGSVRHKAEFRHQVIFLFFYLAAGLTVLAAVALRNDRLFILGYAIGGLFAMLFVFTRTSVFYFAPGYAIPVRPAFFRPEWDSAAAELTARLTGLMESGAPYKDAELTIKDLADMLGIDPKRLSYHLHAALSVSFRNYINEWRLEAIAQDLVGRPERSILDTAFESGFNSKSSFNTLFAQKYGMTPSEYRRLNSPPSRDGLDPRRST